MKYEGERLYSARSLRDLIGLPEEVCMEKCHSIGGMYSLREAKEALATYQADRKRRIAMFNKLASEHKCVHRVGYNYCEKPAFMAGWPYCFEHLPESAKARRNFVELRKAHRAHGICICISKDGKMCENPVKPGKIRCEEHIKAMKDRQ